MKDPAFLFYSSDFLSGVQDLTMEERGQYITLLCIQHQKGRLTEKMIRLCHGISSGTISADVLQKFEVDENGLYYNARLEAEIDRRKQHTEKQRVRAIEGWKKRKSSTSSGNATAYATAMPLENENENENINNKKRSKDFKNVAYFSNCNLYSYSELSEEFRSMYTEDIWVKWQNINKYIDENFPNIRLIENQMTIFEYSKLKSEFIDTRKISSEKMIEIMNNFNNWKKGKDTYNSVYPALRNWIKKEI